MASSDTFNEIHFCAVFALTLVICISAFQRIDLFMLTVMYEFRLTNIAGLNQPQRIFRSERKNRHIGFYIGYACCGWLMLGYYVLLYELGMIFVFF